MNDRGACTETKGSQWEGRNKMGQQVWRGGGGKGCKARENRGSRQKLTAQSNGRMAKRLSVLQLPICGCRLPVAGCRLPYCNPFMALQPRIKRDGRNLLLSHYPSPFLRHTHSVPLSLYLTFCLSVCPDTPPIFVSYSLSLSVFYWLSVFQSIFLNLLLFTCLYVGYNAYMSISVSLSKTVCFPVFPSHYL